MPIEITDLHIDEYERSYGANPWNQVEDTRGIRTRSESSGSSGSSDSGANTAESETCSSITNGTMPILEKIGRRNVIPVIYTRGTHYEVGFDVGRTFSGLIHSMLRSSGSLNEVYLPLYETPEGKKVYDDTLEIVQKNFPQYVEEIQGTADGAKVSFHKLFLLHMDEITPNVAERAKHRYSDATTGCSTVCCNRPGEEYLGHTEDALAETLNHVYLVSAHIISDEPRGRWAVREEKFTSLCYAGFLPGFTMGYNHHGLVYSINIVKAAKLGRANTPRHILTRALLAAENLVQVTAILKDEGVGIADGVSVNLTFLQSSGDRIFYNIEAGHDHGQATSAVSVNECPSGKYIFHANKFLRLNIPEEGGMIVSSSSDRHATVESQPEPRTFQDVCRLLGDQSHSTHTIFRESGDDDYVKTVAVGIFDCAARTWSVYADNPKTSLPIVVLPMVVKGDN